MRTLIIALSIALAAAHPLAAQFPPDVAVGTVGASMGAGFGLVLGAIFPVERWRRIRLR